MTKLNDVADELCIIDQRTINKLFDLDNCADCVALYVFLYKTAKWQGTRSVKANDVYIRKCLGWGAKKVTTTKKLLEDNGLIKTVARRKDGKIVGHFIEVAYLLHHNTQKPLVDETTCGFRETNTNKLNIDTKELNLDTNKDSKESLGEIATKDTDSSLQVVERTQRSLDIDKAFEIWEEVMGMPIVGNKGDERFAINTLLSRKGMDLDKLRTMLLLAREADTDRYKRFSITCFRDLQRNSNALLAWARERQAQQHKAASVAEV